MYGTPVTTPRERSRRTRSCTDRSVLRIKKGVEVEAFWDGHWKQATVVNEGVTIYPDGKHRRFVDVHYNGDLPFQVHRHNSKDEFATPPRVRRSSSTVSSVPKTTLISHTTKRAAQASALRQSSLPIETSHFNSLMSRENKIQKTAERQSSLPTQTLRFNSLRSTENKKQKTAESGQPGNDTTRKAKRKQQISKMKDSLSSNKKQNKKTAFEKTEKISKDLQAQLGKEIRMLQARDVLKSMAGTNKAVVVHFAQKNVNGRFKEVIKEKAFVKHVDTNTITLRYSSTQRENRNLSYAEAEAHIPILKEVFGKLKKKERGNSLINTSCRHVRKSTLVQREKMPQSLKELAKARKNIRVTDMIGSEESFTKCPNMEAGFLARIKPWFNKINKSVAYLKNETKKKTKMTKTQIAALCMEEAEKLDAVFEKYLKAPTPEERKNVCFYS